MPDHLTAALEEIGELVSERGGLMDRMDTAPGMSEEWAAAQAEVERAKEHLRDLQGWQRIQQQIAESQAQEPPDGT